MRKDSTAEKRFFVELGPEFGNNIVIERGLIPGEMIVDEGYHKLTPGVKMRLGEAPKEEENKDE